MSFRYIALVPYPGGEHRAVFVRSEKGALAYGFDLEGRRAQIRKVDVTKRFETRRQLYDFLLRRTK